MKKRRLPKITILTFVCVCVNILSAKAEYNPRFMQEYFTGYILSPKSQAMGRTGVALGDGANSIFQNPAGIGTVEHADFSFFTNASYYLLRNSDYFYLGATYRVHPKMVVAAAMNTFAMGATTFTLDILGQDYPVDKPLVTNFTIDFSGSPIENLHLGMNFNYFRYKYIKESPISRTIHLDVGALYELLLNKEQRKIGFGVSLANLSFSKVKLTAPNGNSTKIELPVYVRYGLAYSDAWDVIPTKSDLPGDLSIMVLMDIEDVINSKFRTAFEIGYEINLLSIFAFRMGYRLHKEDDLGNAANNSLVKGITYGFGLNVPVRTISNDKVPIDISFDYTSHNQHAFREGGSFLPNVRGFGLKVIWIPTVKNQ